MANELPDTQTFTAAGLGSSSHPAREAWLLDELEQWFAGDLADGRERRRIVAGALRSATEDAHRWLNERLAADAVVRVDLQLEGVDRVRHSVFPTLPSPSPCSSSASTSAASATRSSSPRSWPSPAASWPGPPGPSAWTRPRR